MIERRIFFRTPFECSIRILASVHERSICSAMQQRKERDPANEEEEYISSALLYDVPVEPIPLFFVSQLLSVLIFQHLRETKRKEYCRRFRITVFHKITVFRFRHVLWLPNIEQISGKQSC